MPAVAWKSGGLWIRVKGPGLGFKPSNKKLVEALEGFLRICELGCIEAEFLDKGGHQRATRGAGHPTTIPAGEKRLPYYLLQ